MDNSRAAGHDGRAAGRRGPLTCPGPSNEMLGISLQVIRGDARVLGDSSKHFGANFFSVVKCEDEICVSSAAKRAMRPGLTLELPPDA